MDHTYRTYEPESKDGYKSYIFDGTPVKDRTFDTIYPSKHKDEINKPLGDVFSIEVSSFCLNEKAYNILKPCLENSCRYLKP